MSDAPKRFVIDTNTLVSAALFPKRPPGQSLDKAVSEGLILFSAQTFAEFSEVLSRKKFEKYLSETKRKAFVDAIDTVSSTVVIRESITACRDPKDDKFLEVAVNGFATAIVTGDEDLLVLNPFRNIAIVNARAFLETFFSAE